jgi:hypothetical protein
MIGDVGYRRVGGIEAAIILVWPYLGNAEVAVACMIGTEAVDYDP